MANARVFDVKSSNFQIPLLELYSSEGCSSCPPADKWMNELKSSRKLFIDFVPLAFHVDYWDYIGWRDRFARSDYTSRQKVLARGETMYTPEFFLNGIEWRDRDISKLKPSKVNAGFLAAKTIDDAVEILFTPARKLSRVTFYAARLLMNQNSAVQRGENRGTDLHHEFVVDELISVPGQQKNASTYIARLKFSHSSIHDEKAALAFWVTDARSELPLQAIGVKAQ